MSPMLTAAEVAELRAAALTLMDSAGDVRRLAGGMWAPVPGATSVPCHLGSAGAGRAGAAGAPTGQPLEGRQYYAKLVMPTGTDVRPADAVLVVQDGEVYRFLVDSIEADQLVHLTLNGRVDG
mgnify:CR=1 FL=1